VKTLHPRSHSRVLAMKVLYQCDVATESDPEIIDRLISEARLDDEIDADVLESSRAYTRTLVLGVLTYKDELDARIKAISANWPVRRMAVIDRNLIRVGGYELLHRSEIPRAVAIDEALRLAKRYSGEGASSFINGILDQFPRAEGQGE